MNESFKQLKNRVDATATNRFNASNRLKNHNNFSIYVVMLFSLGLILVSLASTLNLTINITKQSLDLTSIFLSIVILVISTALSMNNFGVRSEKFHDCGRELQTLLIRINKILSKEEYQTSEQYDEIQSEYETILSKYENHKTIDFLYTKARWTKTYEPKLYRYPLAIAFSFVEHSIYLVLTLVEIFWLYYVFINHSG